MTDSLERVIATTDNIFGIAANTTDIINTAIQKHDLGPTAAAALGRALTGALLLAALLKDNQSIQLTFEGSGPLEKVIAEAGSEGWCRGYVARPHADVPLKDGLIDVASGIGHAGFLRVVKDIGMKEKYTGLVQLTTSQIGDDIAHYLTESEQTPSTISLGMHIKPNGTVSAAGGFLIQTLPPADDSKIDEIEANISKQGTVSQLIGSGVSPHEILDRIFVTIPHKYTGSNSVSFCCTCSEKKMQQALYTLDTNDILHLLEQEDGITMKCDYCSESFFFSKNFLLSLLKDTPQ